MIGKRYEYHDKKNDTLAFFSHIQLSRDELNLALNALQYYVTKKGIHYDTVKEVVELEKTLHEVYASEPVKIDSLTEVPAI